MKENYIAAIQNHKTRGTHTFETLLKAEATV